jgi:hypothetical protein
MAHLTADAPRALRSVSGVTWLSICSAASSSDRISSGSNLCAIGRFQPALRRHVGSAAWNAGESWAMPRATRRSPGGRIAEQIVATPATPCHVAAWI